MFDFLELGDAEEAEEEEEAVAAVAAMEEAEQSRVEAAAGSAGAAAAEVQTPSHPHQADDHAGDPPLDSATSGTEREVAEERREESARPAPGGQEEPASGALSPAAPSRPAAVSREPATAAEPPMEAQEAPAAVPAAPPALLSAAVGEHFVSVARVQMRKGESQTSEKVGLLPAQRLLEVLQVGRMPRRVRVLEETGVEGWVSLAKESGEKLLESRPHLSARETFNFRRLKEDREQQARAPPPPAPPTAPSAPSSAGPLKCDKCDGPHATDACPFFKKAREDHKDAWANYGQKNPLKMGSDGGNFTLRGAKVIRQPGDGSCLFHSLSFGLNNGRPSPSAAEALRRELAAYIERNPQKEIGGDTIEEWVRWDANSSVSAYAAQMGRRGWGGGVEMAVCSILKTVNVHVYEAHNGDFKRISCFDSPGSSRTVHVLYQGRCHYDALVPAN